MRPRIEVYVASIIVAASAATAAFMVFVPSLHTPIKYLIFLVIMGVVAESLALLSLSGAASTIASIPFQCAALISPDWKGIVTVATAETIAQLIHRRGWVKGLFNIAQITLSTAVAVGGYRLAGGTALLNDEVASFTNATWTNGLPAIVLISLYFLTNTFAVGAAIAFSDGRPLMHVWRRGNLSTLAYQLLSSPFVFFFSWATAKFGPIGATLLTLPVVGIRQLYKTKLELEQSHQDMLELMVKAIEARDPYTSGHSRRVQHYSIVIARAIDLTDQEVQRIGVAALLHDVGKIHEKYAPLLRKPDKLSPEEWKVMEQHPVDGAALVATAGQLRDLVSPIRHHHERWDGAGYPDGLKGEAIPLASRIITFADTIDAMTTARPYRGPLGEDQVRAELIRCQGKQFDPKICDTLLHSPLWTLLFAPNKETQESAPVRSQFSIIRGGRVTMGTR